MYLKYMYLNYLYFNYSNTANYNQILPVIELLGVGRVQPPVHFSTPQLILKNYLGGQAKPPRAAFSNSMYLALCLHPKISNTCEFQDDPIIRGYNSLVDYLLIYFNRCHTCGCSIFVHLSHIHSGLLICKYQASQKMARAALRRRVIDGQFAVKRGDACLLFGGQAGHLWHVQTQARRAIQTDQKWPSHMRRPVYTAMYICVCTVDHARSKAQTRPNAIHKINGITS